MPAYAMWKDESFGIPNKALLKLATHTDVQYDPIDQRAFLSQFKLYTEDFSRQLSVDEFPIVELCRNQKPFTNRRIGMRHPKTNAKLIFDVHGEMITDEASHFLGGLVIFKDVTELTTRLAQQVRENEQQFESIANMIPPLVWTAPPNGQPDWFSQRWYDYTGSAEDASVGDGWIDWIHPDDMPETAKAWSHALASGDEYIIEYRVRRHDGMWRWMLGRALPLRDTYGRIIKWFGTCTDIHELVEARQAAKSLREQLLRVIEHAHVTLWAVDRDRNLTLLEGSVMHKSHSDGYAPGMEPKPLGKNIYDVFGQKDGAEDISFLKKPIEDVLEHRASDGFIEFHVDASGRWFRSRVLPLYHQDRTLGMEGEKIIDGVIGVSMDVTELRAREDELQQQERENAKLLANAVAAKEASRMKSQFLANVRPIKVIVVYQGSHD